MKLTFLDFETANRERSSVCSVGISVWENGKEIDNFYSLIKPTPYAVDRLNTNVNGLEYCHLCDAPEFEDVYSKFQKYLQGIVISHNAAFDMGCLSSILTVKRIRPPEFKYLCSLELAKTKYDKPNLDKLAEIYGISTENHHNALADARMLGAIYHKMRSEFTEETRQSFLRDFIFIFYNTFVAYQEKEQIKDVCKTKGGLPFQEPENIDFENKKFVITGQFQYFSRSAVAEFLKSKGCQIQLGPTKQSDYILVGSIASDSWKNGDYGTKIERALTLPNIVFLDEEYFSRNFYR